MDHLLPELDASDDPITDDLIDAAFAEGPGEPSRVVDSITLDDDRAAERQMRKLARLYARINELAEQREAWMAEIQAWFDTEVQPVANRIAFIEDVLERYGLAVRALGERKTVTLPSGTIRTTQAKEPVVQIDADADLIAWADESLAGSMYESVVKTEHRALVSELRKIVEVKEVDGELVVLFKGERVPGVSARPPQASATVTPRTP